MTVSTMVLPEPAHRTTIDEAGPSSSIELRTARASDADAMHDLVADHVVSDHLLPRTREEIACRIPRFVVEAAGEAIVGCAEMALSGAVAEVPLASEQVRGLGMRRATLEELVRRVRLDGHERRSAFTPRPAYFLRLGSLNVPHPWVREQIGTDCVSYPVFRACGPHALVLPLDAARSRNAEMRPAT